MKVFKGMVIAATNTYGKKGMSFNTTSGIYLLKPMIRKTINNWNERLENKLVYMIEEWLFFIFSASKYKNRVIDLVMPIPPITVMINAKLCVIDKIP